MFSVLILNDFEFGTKTKLIVEDDGIHTAETKTMIASHHLVETCILIWNGEEFAKGQFFFTWGETGLCP